MVVEVVVVVVRTTTRTTEGSGTAIQSNAAPCERQRERRKVVLEVTRPEEKVGVAGAKTTGGSPGSSSLNVSKPEGNTEFFLAGRRIEAG